MLFKDRLALTISRLLDPIIILPLTLLVFTFTYLVEGFHQGFLVLVFSVNVLLPMVVFVLLVLRKRIDSGWNVVNRAERVPLLLTVTGLHLVSVLVGWWLQMRPLADYLTSLWVLTLIFTVITFVWKISLHVGVLSSLISFVCWLYGWQFGWLYALVALLAWARVEGEFHRVGQVIAGAIIPAVVIPLVLFVLN